ncbi:MAG: arsenate reductase ArsC [Woeseiaceae bacterium]
MSRDSVLFLCTGSSARSQMAEAFLRELAGDRYEAYSAGLDPRPIHPLTYRVMREVGFHLGGHTSKSVRNFLGRCHFGYVITVCDQAEKNCPTTFPGHPVRLHWSFPDPSGAAGSEAGRLAVFRDVRDAIRAQVVRFLEIPVRGSEV